SSAWTLIRSQYPHVDDSIAFTPLLNRSNHSQGRQTQAQVLKVINALDEHGVQGVLLRGVDAVEEPYWSTPHPRVHSDAVLLEWLGGDDQVLAGQGSTPKVIQHSLQGVAVLAKRSRLVLFNQVVGDQRLDMRPNLRIDTLPCGKRSVLNNRRFLRI